MTGHKKEPRGGQGFIMKLKAAVCLALFILCNHYDTFEESACGSKNKSLSEISIDVHS